MQGSSGISSTRACQRQSQCVAFALPRTQVWQARVEHVVPRCTVCCHATESPSSQVQQGLIQHKLRNLSLEVPVTWDDHPGCVLVVRPMSLEWRAPVAQLLTDAFVEAARFNSYRKLLKHRISGYLEGQAALFPQSIILTATLRPPPPQHHSLQGNDLLRDKWDLEHEAQGPGMHQQGKQHGSPTASAADSLVASLSAGAAYPEHSAMLHASDNGLEGTPMDGTAHSTGPVDMASSSTSNVQNSTTTSGKQKGKAEVLLGTAEVSFDRRTHSMSLFLNPPAKAAYLCNMAVHPDWRRRGVGLELIRGVEEACRVAGERDLYLHLRFKDSEASAGALYRAAGFEESAADPWLVKLFGQEQKRLMVKRLAEEGLSGH